MARSRSNSRQLVQLLEASSGPIYLLDSGRTIVYCNHACLDWLGIEEAELVGIQCNYHSETVLTNEKGGEVAAGLCPPPEAFSKRTSGEVYCRQSAGKLSRRRADFIPLELDQDGAVMVLVDSQNAKEQEMPCDAIDEAGPVELHRQLFEFRQKIGQRYQSSHLVGQGRELARVHEQVELAIAGQAPISIVGPSGSGRQHIARTIHYGNHPQSAGPLVPLSCPLCDAEMVQAAIRELKLTTATSNASPATLLLLEADCLDEGAQYELYGFLRLPNFQLHTIATSQKSLLAAAKAGTFLHDLALQLSGLVIEIPCLANRSEDVPLLAQCFLEEINAQGQRQYSGFTPEALDQLVAYAWPGNVVELREIVEEAARQSESSLITANDLPTQIQMSLRAAVNAPRKEEEILLDDFLAEIERELIGRALRRSKGNKTKTAQRLGISRARLLRRIDQLGLLQGNRSENNGAGYE